MNKPSTVLELLSDPKKWTQDVEARDSQGMPTDVNNNDTTCWCLLGAIAYIYGSEHHDSKCSNLQRAIDDTCSDGKSVNIIDFNDAHSRTHKEILAVLEKAQI